MTAASPLSSRATRPSSRGRAAASLLLAKRAQAGTTRQEPSLKRAVTASYWGAPGLGGVRKAGARHASRHRERQARRVSMVGPCSKAGRAKEGESAGGIDEVDYTRRRRGNARENGAERAPSCGGVLR